MRTLLDDIRDLRRGRLRPERTDDRPDRDDAGRLLTADAARDREWFDARWNVKRGG